MEFLWFFLCKERTTAHSLTQRYARQGHPACRQILWSVTSVVVDEPLPFCSTAPLATFFVGVAGGQPLPAHRAEPVVPHGAQRLGGIAVVPPFAAQRVAHVPIGRPRRSVFRCHPAVILGRRENADGPEQHGAALVGNAPLVIGRVRVVLFPTRSAVRRSRSSCGGRSSAQNGLPPGRWAQLLYIISQSSHRQPPQQQAAGLQRLGAAMFHGKPPSFCFKAPGQRRAARNRRSSASAICQSFLQLGAVERAVDEHDRPHQHEFDHKMLVEHHAHAGGRQRQQKPGDGAPVVGDGAVIILPGDSTVQKTSPRWRPPPPPAAPVTLYSGTSQAHRATLTATPSATPMVSWWGRRAMAFAVDRGLR